MYTDKKIFQQYWNPSSAFKLIEKEGNTFCPIEYFFNKENSGFDYYAECKIFTITPLCGCGGKKDDKLEKLLYFLEKAEKNDYEYIHENEVIYSFITSYGYIEHGSSIGSSWLTERGKMVVEFIRYLKSIDFNFSF